MSAPKRGIANRICGHMQKAVFKGNLDVKRAVYAIIFPKRCIYIGLSIDPKARFQGHLRVPKGALHQPFFAKVTSLLRQRGEFFLSEIHPSRTANGILAHFKDQQGIEHSFNSYAHTSDQIESAANVVGLNVVQTRSVKGGAALVEIKPEWKK